ncbi:MAG: PilZ domain-containing protein [Alphaproteobacteria bacterium]|nr:PilZ domain-containing protein [Alphaproteobacteria bacterium]
MSLEQPSNTIAAKMVAEDTESDDRKPRFAHRKHAASAGMVYSDEINGAVHCIVRDMSATGARLLIKESKLVPKTNGKPGLPKTFTLNIRLDRVAVECRVVWQDGDEVGVRFAAAPRVLSRTLR